MRPTWEERLRFERYLEEAPGMSLVTPATAVRSTTTVGGSAAV